MAPTEGRFAMPERRWDCRHGTPATAVNMTSTVRRSSRPRRQTDRHRLTDRQTHRQTDRLTATIRTNTNV